MTRFARILLIILFGAYLQGCASLQPGYEMPVVSVTSFKALPGVGIVPRFEIGLHIVNPNRSTLDLKGISYTITLEDHKLLTGVSNKLSKIEAYGEGDVLLAASLDFFNSMGFFADLAKRQTHQGFAYSLEAKLDVGTLHPVIRASKKGTLSLFDLQQNQ